MKASFAAIVIAAAIACLSLGCEPSHREIEDTNASLAGSANGWNVLVLSVDTLRADRLNTYGYTERTTSPRIDELLAGGVQFERAMAPRSMTWPSLSSMLTGQYPTTHGVVQNGYELPEGLATLPLVLQDAGYQTAAFLSNMCRAGHRGWDAFACAKGTDGKVNRSALEWAATLDSERPFLLWAHYFGAHPPYYNGGDLASTELDPGYDGLVQPKKGVLDAIVREKTPLDEDDLQHLDAIYDASVVGSDRTLGRLLDGLTDLGLLENTLILFLSDHGEDLWDHHEYLYHACSVYQSSLHVPLGFVAPGVLPAGRRIADTVELVDVLSTTLTLLGLETPGAQDGRSLVPYFEPEGKIRRRPSFSEYTGTPIRTVVDYPWSLIVNPERVSPLCFKDAPEDLYPIAELELYNLAEDPLELENVAAEHPDQVERLRELISRRFATLAPSGQEEQELPDDLKRELEALGYVN